jgi:serine/threonine protein kinase/class 3 adenylate cyclase
MNIEKTPGQRARVEEFQRKHRIVLLTLLFTDVVGSTHLKQLLGERAAIELTERHHALLRTILRAFPDAEEIDTAGDSFFMVFAKPSDAVQFALLSQRAVRDLARETGQPVLDRIGIHVGEVFIQDRGRERRNLFGIQIDSTARIMSLASADQILLSRFAFDNARLVLRGFEIPGIGELSWLNHGYYELKGVEDPLEVCEVGEVGAASLAAPGESKKAHRFRSPDAEPVLGWRPSAGQLVPNTQWTLERSLGEGGFGEVWLARHATLKQQRVIKFCFRADRVRSLKREVTLFRVLRERVGDQPGIVTVHDVFFDEPPFYIVMDFVDGPNLAIWAEAHHPPEDIQFAVRLEIVAQVADALQAAHDAGVIHRDVKPSNILITKVGGELRARLTDFGIGQVVSAEALVGVTKLGFTETIFSTSSGTGTQLYMAPELFAGKAASIRSDIYSLGVVLYQLLMGDFTRPVTTDWAKSIHDPLLREDLGKCFAGEPQERFAGAGQLGEHLRSLKQRQTAFTEQQRVLAAVGRAAYRKGIIRSTAVATCIVALVASLALYAVSAKRRAQANLQRAEAGEHRAHDSEKLIGELSIHTSKADQAALSRVLAFAGEEDLLSFQQTLHPYDLAAALNRASDLSETVLRYKLVVLDALIENRILRERTDSPETRSLIDNLRTKKQRLFELQLSETTSTAQEQSALRDEIVSLEARLAGVAGGRVHRASTVTVEQVQRMLASDEALLEYFKYSRPSNNGWEVSYGIVVITSKEKPTWMALGSATTIEKAVQGYQTSIRNGTDEAALAKHLESLYSLLWAPIADRLSSGHIKKTFISPDGEVNRISFAALLTPANTFLGENYEISYLGSGRDLLLEASPVVEQTAVIFAAPDFQAQRHSESASSRSVAKPDLEEFTLYPLPGTETEARRLQAELTKVGWQTTLFLGGDATEEKLKGVPVCRILHFATHGFYLNAPETSSVFKSESAAEVKSNPMERSGLMLSGAQFTLNAWKRGEVPMTANDGVVTSAEIATLHLSGTWLVVLSVSGGGGGEVKAGEGVIGLRRAFRIAGAQNVLDTLWEVRDAETADFMTDFYAAALQGKNINRALAQTQCNWLVRLRREQGLTNAVTTAGPFVLSFQGRP